jgi:LEA14-like dessication related protein
VKPFVNAVLIGMLAFFAFLGVLLKLNPPPASDSSSGDGFPHVDDVSLSWVGPETINVGLAIRNAGAAANATTLSYQATVGGQTMAQANRASQVVLPAGARTTYNFTVALPPDFPKTWWHLYVDGGEKSGLHLSGSLLVGQGATSRAVPFQWDSSWQGGLASSMTSSAQNCDTASEGVCLASAAASWDGRSLRTTLQLRDLGPDAVRVRNGSTLLVLGGQTVASGTIASGTSMSAGSDGTATVLLGFGDDAVARWWPDHVARCESSPAALSITLLVETSPGGGGLPRNSSAPDQPRTLQWTFPAPAFDTGLVCGKGG